MKQHEEEEEVGRRYFPTLTSMLPEVKEEEAPAKDSRYEGSAE